MNFHKNKRKPLDISLTPMIDVVFLLLIFFMVTTTFNKESTIEVTLATADGQAVETLETRETILTIDKSGRYFIDDDDKALSDKNLETLIAALTASKNNKDIPLTIRADEDTPLQLAISVIDAASKIGFSRIAFATQKHR